jgi:peptidoglycan/LPS O-acetylase OafA/YrhL
MSITRGQTRTGAGPGPSLKRLAGVDGLRAAAALWVVLFHIRYYSHPHLPIPGADLFMRSGSTGVSLFLVLSGFCLYLPFAGGRTDRFNCSQFLTRRCRRLLPAYYVSLLFVIAFTFARAIFTGTDHGALTDLTVQLFTHVTFTHSMFPSTFYALDGAYWSLGLEWQLYLGLPLLVWGVSRHGLGRTLAAVVALNVAYRIGLAVAIGQGFVAAHSSLANDVLPNQLPGRWAEFASGMLVAELYITGRLAKLVIRSRLATLALVLVGMVAGLSSGWDFSHLLYGIAFALLLSLVLVGDNPISLLFALPPLRTIGLMSYSLYLVHQPLVSGLAFALQHSFHASPNETFYILVLSIPLIVSMAWILFKVAEQRTLMSRSSLPVVTRAPKPVVAAADG